MTMTQYSPRLLLLAAMTGLLLLAGCERAAKPPTSDNATSGKNTTASALPDKHRVVAYYFHRALRCATCLSIEKQAREAVQTGYSGDLKSGRLEWRLVNIEDQGNEHFTQDFELETSSLVLAEMAGNKTLRWKMLVDVWSLVDEPLAFQQYVWAEVDEFLSSLPEADAPKGTTP